MAERRLSVLVFSLFSSWLLAFAFEGQVWYALAERYALAAPATVFGSIAAHFLGLLLGGFLVKSLRAARRLLLYGLALILLSSAVFFFAPPVLWHPLLTADSFLAGMVIAAWGCFLWSSTPANERMGTVADGLIYSNLLMILLNMTAIHLSPQVGLAMSMVMVAGALWFAAQLPAQRPARVAAAVPAVPPGVRLGKSLAFLYLFIVVITIDSGLMYQVINPAFAHHEWLVSWYWALPYIIALYIVKNLSRTANQSYILYVAIAMIGFAYVAFMSFDRSVPSYLLVNTLMLGACGVYDLFWWSILGEMLDYHQNPARILGIGLSANVLGVLLGGLLGSAITGLGTQVASGLALVVVLVTLMLLPPLHKRLSALVKNHAYLPAPPAMPEMTVPGRPDWLPLDHLLTEREAEVARLLLGGRTYKMIADELRVSENTVKTHIKNIYSKLGIQSKAELVGLLAPQGKKGTG